MSERHSPTVFLCNSADPPAGLENFKGTLLAYGSSQANVRLGLPDFVRSVFHLPDRCLDLLEIAAYVFAGDRLTSRGAKDSVEYQSWGRRFHYVVRVRDHDFWSRPEVQETLQEALRFMTGDSSYDFTFQTGHVTHPTGLFDRKDFQIGSTENLSVMLFSGGLDSLAGAIQQLCDTSDNICLVSHQSGQPSTVTTQHALAQALRKAYPDRVSHYPFRTGLRGIRAKEETQRTRSFLFGSIAFALALAFRRSEMLVYENGITSLNFTRRDDLLNARASRTTHPQTLGRLATLFSMIMDQQFRIETPFLSKTKTDVIAQVIAAGKGTLISSSVSCSHTFKGPISATHCGECFQCIDRRIGVYGAHAVAYDFPGLYAKDILTNGIPSPENKTTIVDYLRQAANFAKWNLDYFYGQTLDDLQHLDTWTPGINDEMKLVNEVWALCSRHGSQVRNALQRMRERHEDVFGPLSPGSLLSLVSDREFLREPVERLIASIQSRLKEAVPNSFQTHPPQNERDLNDKIEGLLTSWRDDLQREHSTVPFAGAGVVADFAVGGDCVLVEGKYIRTNTPPSKATEGMAADLTKYPQQAYILFVVYDPERQIVDRAKFKSDFESRGRCTVLVLP